MKWVRFRTEGGETFGLLDGETIRPVDLDWESILSGARPESGAGLGADEVQLLAPIGRPGKIVAIGLNYMDHCIEQKIDPPDRPLIFTKFSTSIIGPGDAIRWSGGLTQQVDYEVELAVIIGRTACRIDAGTALDHVFGYTVANDVSARDLQFGDGQWVRGKSLDTFCPLGPVLVTADEIPDSQNLAIRCHVNDVLLQDGHTRDMIFGVAELVSFCSQSFTLEPGDVILTGTPDGVGVFRDPKIFLGNGDRVVTEIEGIGRLENDCIVD